MECTNTQDEQVTVKSSDSTYGHHQMVNTEIRLVMFFVVKDGEALYSQKKTRPGADCGSDHELLIVKFRVVKILI